MECCFEIFGCLSCLANVRNAYVNLFKKICPCCHKKKKEVDAFEETFKIKFLDNTILSFEKVIDKPTD